MKKCSRLKAWQLCTLSLACGVPVVACHNRTARRALTASGRYVIIASSGRPAPLWSSPLTPLRCLPRPLPVLHRLQARQADLPRESRSPQDTHLSCARKRDRARHHRECLSTHRSDERPPSGPFHTCQRGRGRDRGPCRRWQTPCGRSPRRSRACQYLLIPAQNLPPWSRGRVYAPLPPNGTSSVFNRSTALAKVVWAPKPQANRDR